MFNHLVSRSLAVSSNIRVTNYSNGVQFEASQSDLRIVECNYSVPSSDLGILIELAKSPVGLLMFTDNEPSFRTRQIVVGIDRYELHREQHVLPTWVL